MPLNTNSAAMTAAWIRSPTTSSTTTASSSIQGTGAQKRINAICHTFAAVSGMAFGPTSARRRCAASLVNPRCEVMRASAVSIVCNCAIGGTLLALFPGRRKRGCAQLPTRQDDVWGVKYAAVWLASSGRIYSGIGPFTGSSCISRWSVAV